MDLLLPTDDPKPKLLQSPQRQPSTSVRSPFRPGRDYTQRPGKFQVYNNWLVL